MHRSIPSHSLQTEPLHMHMGDFDRQTADAFTKHIASQKTELETAFLKKEI